MYFYVPRVGGDCRSHHTYIRFRKRRGRDADIAEYPTSTRRDGDRLTFAGDAVFQVGFDHPDWHNGFEHDPEEAARVRVHLLRELAANRKPLVATHMSFPSLGHVAAAGEAFRWVPDFWEYRAPGWLRD